MPNCFVVADPVKCIGCRTCEIACVVAHSKKDIFTSEVSEIEFFPRLNVVKNAKVSAPIQCRQCEDALCAKACPVDAISTKNGYVQVEEGKCIGCKTCTVACPIGAIDMIPEFKDGKRVFQAKIKVNDENSSQEGKERIVARKCDVCSGREGGPACAEVCPTKALKIVDHEEMERMIKEKRKNNANEILDNMNQIG
ncbi:formate dehydrogenase [Clostridium carboxidivorans P7]|uniref:4Fe-4S ferredoxin iron-sulfur binding domain protein n=1 Tax=Clostridium carboxidivorans P7 TaxID=536227 RepID=C6Q019_9CLOT|nr:4Fe-4S dicluster domain-containing protein [Clostridium carboxidivorans]AKN32293.1 formate dehydrogenase [Clostridium carboxidivorans P7]EET85160.1 4Fe-4S ferredoxin iron-sulfur binding domain protein [Clostridium carboxidivorans P7]